LGMFHEILVPTDLTDRTIEAPDAAVKLGPQPARLTSRSST